MSKASKSRAKIQRKSMKRSRKAAQRAQYESWSAAGQNGKSKRNRLRAGRDRTVSGVSHPDGECGNISCAKCSGQHAGNNPWLASPQSCIFSKRFTSSKWKHMAHA